MAPGVATKLWLIGDIVALLDQGKTIDENMGVYGARGTQHRNRERIEQARRGGWEAVAAVSSDSGCIQEVLFKRETSN